MATASLSAKGTYRKALFKGAMVMCVATSATSFVSQYLPQPTKLKAEEPAPEPSVNFIKGNSLAYTKPKPRASIAIFEVKGVAEMRDNYDDNYLEGLAKHSSIDVGKEETFKLPGKMKFVAEKDINYQYALENVVFNDVSSFDKDSEQRV